MLFILLGYVLRLRFKRVLDARLCIAYPELNLRGLQVVLARGLLNSGLPVVYLPGQFRFAFRDPSRYLGFLHHGYLPSWIQSIMRSYSLGHFITPRSPIKENYNLSSHRGSRAPIE